ncbi:S41 family peptidase [Mesonia ostreae]|uniref:S41 family peptidase n=1 Tax=Mesonia ostreae TaxID=861110 RepID=A0ABU2KJ06_9FLAO|nr:S41 family peptidase [Mesonia ostreae]MDT0294700.1 S41 family peptidase [Mesonia ostreae]
MKKRILVPLLAIGILITTASARYKSDFFEIAKQIEIFTTLFKEINMNYVDETNPADLMDTAITAMLADLDPYTNYWNQQEVEQAKIQNFGQYTGIGANVFTQEHKIKLMEVYQDYPADKAGLKPGDEIIQIGDVMLKDFDEDAGELLKGAPNSKVNLKYIRQGKTEQTTLTREAVEIKAVPFYELTSDKIGYIVLSKFNRKASSEVATALKNLKEQGAEKIILDLRGNPGGLLTEAVNVTNIFVPKGEIITTTKSTIEKYNQIYKTQKDPMDTEIPLAVLINGKSASASEIVSGSLQDLDRAVVIGARSFGKGLVQRPKQLSYGTQLKVTISRYYTPSGRCIQALDYWNRDESGNATKTKVEDYNEFTTRNGRKVYDGGGILPDVKLETSEYSAVTNALLQEQIIFNYATEYYYSHADINLNDFVFTDKDFADFKKFLEKADFSYETDTEKQLKKLMQTSKKEGYQEAIAKTQQNMLKEIEAAKQQQIEAKKHEIERLLSDEIIKRYHYEQGLYTYYLSHNPEIKKAKEILNNSSAYRNILN